MCLSSVHISPYACAYNFMYTHAIETIDALSISEEGATYKNTYVHAFQLGGIN